MSRLPDLERALFDAASRLDARTKPTEDPAGREARNFIAARPRLGSTQRLRVPVAILVTAAIVCVVVLLLPGGGGGTPNLAARAYAATTGTGVIHWRTDMQNYVNGRGSQHERIEGWARDGVTHTVSYAIRRGRARLTADSRTGEGRTKTYVASLDDYISNRAGTDHTTNPLAEGGDPFAVFRRAYRTGRLRKLGPHRYAANLPGSEDDQATRRSTTSTRRPRCRRDSRCSTTTWSLASATTAGS